MKTRKLSAGLALALVAGLLVFDQVQSAELNRFQQPPVFAYGSGQAAGGAHCAALPN